MRKSKSEKREESFANMIRGIEAALPFDFRLDRHDRMVCTFKRERTTRKRATKDKLWGTVSLLFVSHNSQGNYSKSGDHSDVNPYILIEARLPNWITWFPGYWQVMKYRIPLLGKGVACKDYKDAETFVTELLRILSMFPSENPMETMFTQATTAMQKLYNRYPAPEYEWDIDRKDD